MLRNLRNRLLHKLAAVAPGGFTIRVWLHRMRGVRVGKGVWISQSVYIDELHPEAVAIGDHSTIGIRTTIFAHLYWGRHRPNAGRVTIGKDVYIGPHCLILPNVEIGDGAVIKGGTVVSRNVPPHTLWGLSAATALARVTVPLTAGHSYEEFVQGLRPLRSGAKR